MKPLPLRCRILYALELAPMTGRELVRCLSVPQSCVSKMLEHLCRLRAVARAGSVKIVRGRPLTVYGLRT